jgi:ubiquinone/menaquinone biosynthesis C-methylase UbiE
MAQPQPYDHGKYLTGYHKKATQHHEWRDAENSAAHLLPLLRHKVTQNPELSMLDVGAGSGTITTSLARHMPQGRIIATDLSEEILTRAARHAESQGVTNIGTQQANVYELPFEDGSFDIVHASMILAHLDDPVKAIGEMVRCAKKPGGVIALRESDLRAWSFYPEYPGMWAFNRMLCSVHEANGASASTGAQLVSFAMKAGVKREHIKASAGTWCYATPEEREIWGGTMVDRCFNGDTPTKALELGLANDAELKEMADGWSKWMEAADAWFGCVHGEAIIAL